RSTLRSLREVARARALCLMACCALVDQFLRIHHAVRVKMRKDRPQSLNPLRAFFVRQIRRMIKADAVLMADRAATLKDRAADGGFHTLPALDRILGAGA